MDGREFLATAREQLARPCERNWRSATGRAYYALLHEGETALRHWGFLRPPTEQLHTFVRRRFVFTPHPDLRSVGQTLDQLSSWRNQADYQLTRPGNFTNAVCATKAVSDATAMVALLDAIEVDPVRRAAVVAALQVAWPWGRFRGKDSGAGSRFFLSASAR